MNLEGKKKSYTLRKKGDTRKGVSENLRMYFEGRAQPGLPNKTGSKIMGHSQIRCNTNLKELCGSNGGFMQ